MTNVLAAADYLRQLQELIRERYSDPQRSEANRLQHLMRDPYFTKMVSEGAQAMGASCSHGVVLPTPLQDRYEYVILNGLAEKLKKIAVKHKVAMPSSVCVGSLPSGHLDALTFSLPDKNEYVVAYHSGLFAYLHLLAKIVVSCIPWKNDPLNARVEFDVNMEHISEVVCGNTTAISNFRDLMIGCLFEDDPWAIRPFRLPPALGTLAFWLSQSAQAFILGHEFGHIQNHDFDNTQINTTGHEYDQEFSADFIGMQNMFAIMSETDAGFMFSYWGAELFFSGIDSLQRSLAVIDKADAATVPAKLKTSYSGPICQDKFSPCLRWSAYRSFSL